MKTAVLIQARLGSTRLPGKMTLAFDQEAGIFEILLQKLVQIEDLPIYLVTSQRSENDELEEIANAYGVGVFRGSEEDVLDRFIKAADQFDVERVVRVCADNPFLSVPKLKELIALSNANLDADYCSFAIGGKAVILHHLGLFCEVVKTSALKKAYRLTQDTLYLEHVTNFIYTHLDIFKVCLHELGEDYIAHQHIRLTVDTLNDFNLAARIFKAVKDKEFKDALSLLQFIDQNEEWTSVMKNEIVKNTK
ncbi:spore coat polysaccharide biosynthesis protein SpsF [Lishizhenia tianjinensis]|uniref:Spore coat polysaccharide biosynthesis protein SpsF n=1 Tax=Lishizhenia tianjinensis TaxID=477690 RepID=A0A1I6YIY4_9FLAO|nr:hypothetical protein [Lishizhenia tianjinensis]SFT50473.1 spore coat polysaccharide biosynthesis protein SpsF [Lishizhenia tianjinensis]